MNKIKKQIFIFLLLNFAFLSFGQEQDLELAREYFGNQEYEKAQSIFEKLAKNNRNIPLIYDDYLQTLLAIKDYTTAEKLISKQMKKEDENPVYVVDYGALLEVQGKYAPAEKQYQEAIDDFRKEEGKILIVANKLIRLSKSELAEKALLAGRKASKKEYIFAMELAEIYGLQNKSDDMVNEYINYALADKSNLEQVQGALQDRLKKTEDFEKLEQLLLKRLQEDKNEVIYNELLLWLYLQQKLFYRAFIQARALDKRYKLEGSQLLNIGDIAFENQDYKNAMTIYEYVVKTYPRGTNYHIARNSFMEAKEERIKTTYPVEKESIVSLIVDYDQLISELGKNYKTFDAMRNKALLYAFYLEDKEKALKILDEASQISVSNRNFQAQCKIDLGDIYLLKEEPWEATLLYSQAEKLRKESPLGHLAKLKNAKLNYYKGEFELAKEHLDILKEATDREISNDAMDLSLLIQDNTAMDSTGKALKEFSAVELLIFQHKETEALSKLEEVLKNFVGHSLTDEVLWAKAELLLKLDKPKEALKDLEQIVSEYGEDILGDDAHFLIGKLYEETFKDKEKAKEYYLKHIQNYPSSIFTAEARKRFRILRGDFAN